MFLDYYRRGLFTGTGGGLQAGDPEPLPLPARWLTIAANVLLLFSEAVVFLGRGVNVEAPVELLLTSLFVATPVSSLATFLDYNTRGV